MILLQSGIAPPVIALWLGHEDPATTDQYIEADLLMKDKALRRLQPPKEKHARLTGHSSYFSSPIRRLAADWFKIGQYPAWKPWAPIRLIDCEPRIGDASIYDECWVRVQVNGGPMQVCARLVMGWIEGSFYLPFHYVRVGPYWIEDEPISPAITRFTWTNGHPPPRKLQHYELATSINCVEPSWRRAARHNHDFRPSSLAGPVHMLTMRSP